MDEELKKLLDSLYKLEVRIAMLEGYYEKNIDLMELNFNKALMKLHKDAGREWKDGIDTYYRQSNQFLQNPEEVFNSINGV